MREGSDFIECLKNKVDIKGLHYGLLYAVGCYDYVQEKRKENPNYILEADVEFEHNMRAQFMLNMTVDDDRSNLIYIARRALESADEDKSLPMDGKSLDQQWPSGECPKLPSMEVQKGGGYEAVLSTKVASEKEI